MFVYAVATIPLVRRLEDISIYKQVWYADDLSVTGDFNNIRVWFENLLRIGPEYGYFPEPSKSFFVVHASMISEAHSFFKDLGVKISTSCRYLGGMIGCDTGINDFISLRVKEWVHHLELLSNIAINQPQAASAAMTKSMQHEWYFSKGCLPHCSCHFQAIEKQITSSFLPSLFGCDSSTKDHLFQQEWVHWASLMPPPLHISCITPLGMLPNISLMLSKASLLSLSVF
uniref:Reverse transcriptase domain-containing protein n=1 Tax=Amphimedon queenslandica TaxID=400682 RepID=A0A1X7V433_AMPQE